MSNAILAPEFSATPWWWQHAARPSAFECLDYQGCPLYTGNPWFVPIVGNWWRLRDWLEIRRARAA